MTNRIPARPLLGVALVALLAALGPADAAERLGAYPVDASKVSISGISSGAFMANQFHIAHSAEIMGAGLVAGGLYACAVTRVAGDRLEALDAQATGPCMTQPDALPSADSFLGRVQSFADKGWIDPLRGLAGDRVYIYTGAADAVVNPKVVARAAELYEGLGIAAPDLKVVKGEAGHSWVTVSFGVPCAANESPYINACGYDQAGDMLQHIYGALRPKAATLSGAFVEYTQAEFVAGGKTAPNGLLDTGYAYVPASCAPGAAAPCALHVVLHGCEQSVEKLGDEFYRHVGVNEWADTNNIVVLYPQARTVSTADFDPPQATDLFEINPNGCWNWFGYGYDERFAVKDGAQISAIHRMIRRVVGN